MDDDNCPQCGHEFGHYPWCKRAVVDVDLDKQLLEVRVAERSDWTDDMLARAVVWLAGHLRDLPEDVADIVAWARAAQHENDGDDLGALIGELEQDDPEIRPRTDAALERREAARNDGDADA